MKIKNLVRRPLFQLLEVMIAAFILIVCAAPAMEIFTNMFQEQQFIINENQKDHLVRRIYADMVLRLYKREIPIDQLYDNQSQPIPNEQLKKEMAAIGYEAHYSFANLRIKKKKGEKKAKCYLATLTIKVTEKVMKKRIIRFKDEDYPLYTYKIFIDSDCNPKNEKRFEGTSELGNKDTEEYDGTGKLLEEDDEKL